MWADYLHHITVHFPIVMSFVLAGVGTWSVRDPAPQLVGFVRIGGAATLLITSVAVVAGLLITPEAPSDALTYDLGHHRNLGLTAWFAMAAAVGAYEYGVRHDEPGARGFGALAWWAIALAVVGAAHWGGSTLHGEVMPW